MDFPILWLFIGVHWSFYQLVMVIICNSLSVNMPAAYSVTFLELLAVYQIFTTGKRSLRRLCFHRCLSVHRGGLGLFPGGSPFRGFSVQRASVQWVSVQGGLCPGGLCPGVSVQWGLCPRGSLSRGSLSSGVSVMKTPHMVTSKRYASYWNAFLFFMHFREQGLNLAFVGTFL